MLVTTHDWSHPVDVDHLADVKRRLPVLAPSVQHLVLEVLQYALDEAAEGGTTRIDVVLHGDGSIAVVDDGRGTDARSVDGVVRVKPVVATRDLRFYDADEPPLLADGRPRRGLSVVAVASSRLEHVNVRSGGAWTATYERGRPLRSPQPFEGAVDRGTTIRFWPEPQVGVATDVDADELRRLIAGIETAARVTVRDARRC